MVFYNNRFKLPTPMADGDTDPMAVCEITNKCVQLYGTHASTIKLQGSLDGNSWYDLQTMADNVIYTIAQTVRYLRLNIASSDIADAPTVVITGHMLRSF